MGLHCIWLGKVAHSFRFQMSCLTPTKWSTLRSRETVLLWRQHERTALSMCVLPTTAVLTVTLWMDDCLAEFGAGHHTSGRPCFTTDGHFLLRHKYPVARQSTCITAIAWLQICPRRPTPPPSFQSKHRDCEMERSLTADTSDTVWRAARNSAAWSRREFCLACLSSDVASH